MTQVEHSPADEQTPEPPWESLDSVRREVDIEQQRLESILDSLDARAGLLLGFTGVIVGLAATQGRGGVPGAVLAATSAVMSGAVLWPRTQSGMDTKSFAEQYLYLDAEEADKEALKRRQKNLVDNDDLRKAKVRFLKLAVVTLAAAIIVTAIRVVV